MEDWRCKVTEVGDELAIVLVKAHLPALHYTHDVSHGVYQVILGPVALHTLTGASDWGVTNLDTGGRGRDSQEREEDTNSEASHGECETAWRSRQQIQCITECTITKIRKGE